MKKTLLTFLFAVATVVAMAQTKTYTDNLLVKVGENNADPQVTTIFVEQNNDGTYTLSLNNFILTMGEEVMYVGNIVVNNISVKEENGIKSFNTTQSIMITPGNDENVAEDDWMEFEEEVTITLAGKMNAEKLYCNINIEIGFPVNVVFGNENLATTYTDDLLVKINGIDANPQVATIFVEQNNDGTYKLSLNNFILTMDDEVMPVGNIVVNNISVTEENGIKSFNTTQSIMITPGNDENVDAEEWMEFEEEVTITLAGKMDAAKLYCNINIEIGFPVNVVFGKADAVTNIENAVAEKGANVIYDLTGRKVNSIETAGIYIVNGKKVLVK